MPRKAPARLATPVAKPAATKGTQSTINESATSVSATDALQGAPQIETIEISSDEASDEDISDAEDTAEPQHTGGGDNEGDGDGAAKPEAAPPAQQPNGKPPSAEDSDAEPTSPSFGDLREAIDVSALLQQQQQQQAGESNNAAMQRPRTAIVPPSHQSLTTVLSQALRTDDSELLESCLHTADAKTVQNTIERIDSSLAGILLTKLAARLHRRPGRAGNLMQWVQWTLISHGGALASQPQVVQGLGSLQKVLAERAKGLSSLLALKGKLDLLDAQMDLRKRMKQGSGLMLQQGEGEGEGEGDDEGVIWVEGAAAGTNGGSPRRRRAADDSDGASDDDGDGVPAANGFTADSDDDSDESEAGDDGDEDEGVEEGVDEDEVDHDDVDVDDEEDDDESDADAAAPPSKAPKVSRASQPRRK